MKRSEAFPTKFLSKDDIHVPTVGIVEQVINETLGQGDDQEIKPVMYFSSGIPKPMVINNTNWMNVEVLYGNESDDWTGKPIEVWVDPSVAFGGKRIGGLRLRAPAGQSQPVQAAPAADLATGEQWEMFYSLAGTLDGMGITVPEPPETITTQGMLKVLASLRAKLAPKRSEAEITKELGYEQNDQGYPGAWVQAILQAKLAENTFATTGMLNKAKVAADPAATLEQVMSWARAYRGWRNLDKGSDEAAQLANEGKVPA